MRSSASRGEAIRSILREGPVGYALPPVALGLAALAAFPLYIVSPYSVEYVFLIAVVAVGWIAGMGPGLVAAMFAPLTLGYFYLPPLYTRGFTPESWRLMFPFLLFAMGTAWLSGTQCKANSAQSTLLQNQKRFAQILANLPDLAWTVSREGQIVYISPAIATLTGFSSPEFYEGGYRFLRKRIHPDDRKALSRAGKELFTKGQQFDVEFRFRRRDGKWIWLNSRTSGTFRAGMNVLADGVITDVTLRKAADVELKSKTALLEAQLNATVDGILVVDSSGQRVLHNRRFVEIFKIPPELFNTSDDRPLLEYVTSLIRNPEEWLNRVNYFYSHPSETSHDDFELTDGTILERYSSPVVDEAGKHYGRIWAFRDITARKNNEDKLRQLSLVVEQSPAAVVITDIKGNITYVNRKFTECTGYAPEEVVGKNPRILKSGRTTETEYKTLWDTVSRGEEWRGELQNKTKGGEFYWAATTITPIFDSSGTITHFLALSEDITERKAMEAQLRQAQKLEGVGQLAAGVAHEINTPIQFVADNLAFLRDAWTTTSHLLDQYRNSCQNCAGAPSPAVVSQLAVAERDSDWDFISSEVPNAVDQALDGAHRVAQIVKAMKEFSHPDSPDKVPLDLNQAIESTITVARSEWKHVANIVRDFDASMPLVACHPGEINQAVLNLLVNAAHAIGDKNSNGEKGTITIRTRARGPFAEVSITDTGTGVPSSIQTRIFEPFFTTKEVGKGTGQGLALAHSVIVKKHHGRIWFDTEIGIGTTFFMDLPIDPDGMGRLN